MPTRRLAGALVALAAAVAPLAAQQPVDSAYTAEIRRLTPVHEQYRFATELVDHLPASATVPTPLKVLGYVPGTVGRLSKVADINRYFRALDEASPRVRLFSMGQSDEGREMIVAAIADEAVLARMDEERANAAKLADPRTLTKEERARLIATTIPSYWLTGSIHSTETGSPEMLMELAYRLAVDESDWIRTIRANTITLITPVTEVDGRDRIVDVATLSRSLGLGPQGVNLVYWGKYTAHDNNRDGMVLSQKLTQHVVKTWYDWRPLVLHDLHESVPFLYTSTGTGPYNDEFDPIVVDEWHTLAYQEITELTKRGLPGVWTHGFYDGWTPNYMFTVANFHNAIGRFYETYTSMNADCHTVKLQPAQIERRWDRPNVPVNGVQWCIRSNVNYQQSGVLVALKYFAEHRTTFLENFVRKGERTIERGATLAPHAYVLPRAQRRAADAADLVNLFRRHFIEVHEAAADWTDGADTVRTGDWVVRLDQPYSQMARTLLARQRYKPDDPAPYDDTGWSADALRHMTAKPVTSRGILSQRMTLLTADAAVTAPVAAAPMLAVPHLGDWRSAVLPWKVPNVHVADSAFAIGDRTFPAGTWLVTQADAKARATIASLGLVATPIGVLPAQSHKVTPPRIALVHSWVETQNEGWVRFAFDQWQIPYTYFSEQKLRVPGVLEKYDVVVYPHVSAPLATLVNGRPKAGPAIPWKKSALTPDLGGYDETDDMRDGMGWDGVAALRRFVERGGLLLVEGATARAAADMGFNPTVSAVESRNLRVRGSVIRAQLATPSPITYGYDQATFPVYFNQAPLLQIQPRDTTGRLDKYAPAVVAEMEAMRARPILNFHRRADSLLVSGLLLSGDELSGKAAVVDAPVGKGHVVMFAIRPLWRWGTPGTYALALNAIAHWNRLESPRGVPEAVTTRMNSADAGDPSPPSVGELIAH
jgi:hypothetical protein